MTTKKLKLPLRIASSGVKYTLSKSIHEGMVDLTADTGTTYEKHVTESRALEFFERGAWTVIGAKFTIEPGTARFNLTMAQHALVAATPAYEAAKAALAAAEAALEAATKPYLV